MTLSTRDGGEFTSQRTCHWMLNMEKLEKAKNTYSNWNDAVQQQII